MAGVIRDLATALRNDPDLIADSPLRSRLELLDAGQSACHARYLRAYMSWPRWRPGVGEYPECGSWHRNSFSNGVFPFSVALLHHLVPEVAPKSEIARVITMRASAYFMAAERLEFLKVSKGRDAAWWSKRSANHGMIMMFTYLAAMRLAGLENGEAGRMVHEQAFQTLERLYADGSFCEGVHYNGFALAECLPYLHMAARVGSPELSRVWRLFPRVYDWWSLSHDERGRVFANFGDNVGTEPSRERLSVGRFLKNFAENDLGENVSLDTVGPYSPFAWIGRKDPAPVTGLVTRLFRGNQLFYGAYIAEHGVRESGLFVIGSRVQKTHNRNHDVGGFAFYANGWRIAIDRADRQPLANNAVVFIDRNDRVACIVGDRDYNGVIDDDQQPDAQRALLCARVRKADLSFQAEGQKRVAISRWFLYRPEHSCPLVIGTEVRGAKALRPAVAFNLTSEEGAQIPQFGTALYGSDGEWKELDPVEIEGACVFRSEDRRRRPVRFLTWFGPPGESLSDLSAKLPWHE